MSSEGTNHPRRKSFACPLRNQGVPGTIQEADLGHESCNESERRTSQVRRKRGYSDIDNINVNALTINTQASLQKEVEKKIKLISQNKQKKPARKNRKQKQQARGKKKLDSSSSGDFKDTADVFKGFEFNSSSAQKPSPVKNDFQQAVCKFAQKITKTLPDSGQHKKTRVDAAQRFSRVSAAKRAMGLRRTSSFTGIKIQEASSDEELDDLQTDSNLLGGGLRKNSSQLSLLSMSQVSNSSKGFWPNRRPSFGAKDHHMYSNSKYKQRRTKLNLENNQKWNGPHDEQFFRILEGYLDEAIEKFIAPEEAKTIHQSRFALDKQESHRTRSSS